MSGIPIGKNTFTERTDHSQQRYALLCFTTTVQINEIIALRAACSQIKGNPVADSLNAEVIVTKKCIFFVPESENT